MEEWLNREECRNRGEVEGKQQVWREGGREREKEREREREREMQIPWQQQPENKSKIGGSVRYYYSNRRTARSLSFGIC